MTERMSGLLAGVGLALAALPAHANGIEASGVWDCRMDLMLTCPVQRAVGDCTDHGGDIYDAAFQIDFDGSVLTFDTEDGTQEVALFGRTDLDSRRQSVFYGEYDEMLLVSQAVDDELTLYEINIAYAPPINDELRMGHCTPQ